MNAERFSFYIKNPAHLYQITYTELKSLVLQYPYCQNLRYLLLKKSVLENHQDLDQNLQIAATFSSDRNFLYQQMKEGASFDSEADSFVLKEDYIELKGLNTEISNQEQMMPTEAETPIAGIETTIEPAVELPVDESPVATIDEVSEDPPFPISPEPLTEEVIPTTSQSDELETIEDDEWVDITSEMDDLFEEHAPDLEIDLQKAPIEETHASTTEEGNNDVDATLEDDAISIEDLIRLDSLSPLERMEKAKTNANSKTTKDILKEDDTEEMKKKFDFSAIDELIEQAKRDVSLEITNEDFLDITDHSKPSPSPKSSFGSWLKQIQSNEVEEEKEPQENALEIPEAKPEKKKSEKKKKVKKKKKKKKQDKQLAHSTTDEAPLKAKTIAEQSLKENTEIVSETLAHLLVKQENYKKAIKMYEKLSLIFPEKSSFFAEQIKKLKNL